MNFCSFLSRNPPNTDRVNVQCWCYKEAECYVECVTVQHTECTDSVQTVPSATELLLQ